MRNKDFDLMSQDNSCPKYLSEEEYIKKLSKYFVTHEDLKNLEKYLMDYIRGRTFVPKDSGN